jgi:type 2 lantibiotic biosynthesis protein LanM
MFLPTWISDITGEALNVGGLVFELNKSSVEDVVRFANTDQMVITREIVASEHTKTNSFHASFQQEIAVGYSLVMNQIQGKNGDIAERIANIVEAHEGSSRIVLRSSRLYAFMMLDACKRENMRSGLSMSVAFLKLFELHGPLNDNKSSTQSIIAEIRALERMEIPYATVGHLAREIVVEGTTLRQSIDKTSVDAMRSFVGEIDDETLGRERSLIHASCYHSGKTMFPAAAPIVISHRGKLWRTRFLEEVNRIADTLKSTCTRTSGGVAWLSAAPIDHGSPEFTYTGADLYTGNPGIAIFLSSAGAELCDDSYGKLASEAMRPIISSFRCAKERDFIGDVIGIGGLVGVGATLYCLKKISLTSDSYLWREFIPEIWETIDRDLIASDKSFDVTFGAAGLILSLLYDAHQREVELSELVAAHIQENVIWAKDGRYGWKAGKGRPMSGLSHGATGFALAFDRLAQATGKEKYRDLAFRFRACDRLLMDSHTSSGRAKSTAAAPDVQSCRWCHGLVGVGLAYSSRQPSNVPEAEIAYAVKCAHSLGLTHDDSACCGNVGRVELLHYHGCRFGKHKHVRDAIQLATKMICRARERGSYSWRWGGDELNPGFFVGVSGVGYQLLRLASPQQFQSVLIWE